MEDLYTKSEQEMNHTKTRLNEKESELATKSANSSHLESKYQELFQEKIQLTEKLTTTESNLNLKLTELTNYQREYQQKDLQAQILYENLNLEIKLRNEKAAEMEGLKTAFENEKKKNLELSTKMLAEETEQVKIRKELEDAKTEIRHLTSKRKRCETNINQYQMKLRKKQ